MVRACGRDEQNLIYLISSSSRAPGCYSKSLKGLSMKWNPSLLLRRRHMFRSKTKAGLEWNEIMGMVSSSHSWAWYHWNLTVEGTKISLWVSCYFERKGDGQGDMDKGNQFKLKKWKQTKNRTHGSEGTPNYIDTLYIARVIVTIIQAGTYCTELKLYGFKKLVYILSDYIKQNHCPEQ